MYAGVSACGDVQSCLAQCPKYLIGFFFHITWVWGTGKIQAPFS